MDETTVLVTPAEAGERMSVSRQTVYRMIHDGRIRTVTLGRSVRIPVTELARIADGRPMT